MKKINSTDHNIYKGMALIADPIHQYILFTVPEDNSVMETTEKNLIDSPWMQRLRRIYQLQKRALGLSGGGTFALSAFSRHNACCR